jgi:hypothetical protein
VIGSKVGVLTSTSGVSDQLCMRGAACADVLVQPHRGYDDSLIACIV